MLTTPGTLLNGRVAYCQPAAGFRSGIEPVLLAASVHARFGDHVLEAGTGAGAALLCLTARLPEVRVTGVEIDAGLAALAAENARANGFAGVEIIAGDIEAAALPRAFDHAMANPPYHAHDGSVSPIAERDVAKRGSDAVLTRWIERMSQALSPRGGLTLIVSAAMVPVCLGAMQAHRCPCTVLFPLWPKAGRPAKLVLLRGLKDARTPMRLAAGLVLHRDDGSFTQAASGILAGDAALTL
jgi:tRNA1Val (adenine37-N6)-methyltransferase